LAETVPADLEATTLDLSFDDGCRFLRMPVGVRADALRRPFTLQVPAAEGDGVLELETGPGASTISMQLAKNLYLSRDKVLARKVREAFLTWWLERSLTKQEIFALYLNVIEYGPDLYGIGSASRHSFDAPPDRLDPADAAFLATVLPAPKAYHHNFERGSLSPSAESQMRFLLEHMVHKDRIDRDDLDWGL
jgi:membrane peptidoglycan carboxypeptidase